MSFLFLAICTEECVHGVCEEPDRCLCNKAWTGLTCNQCIKPSGCINGDCKGFENTCTCFEGWRGHLCTEPICAPGCNISNILVFTPWLVLNFTALCMAFFTKIDQFWIAS